MQIFMLIRQLDGFDRLKITELRANSNSNSKLELDEVWNSFQNNLKLELSDKIVKIKSYILDFSKFSFF